MDIPFSCFDVSNVAYVCKSQCTFKSVMCKHNLVRCSIRCQRVVAMWINAGQANW